MIKQKLKIIIALCFLINATLLIAQTNIPQNVEISLSKAGNNEEELKKVILHYQKLKDNQKLQAAYFLIANMPEHYSEDYIWTDENGENLNFDELKYPDIKSSLKAFNQLKAKTKIQGKTITYEDVDKISSGLLIRNIDLAFEVWQKPWNKNLSFEDFCEYILPYRVCDEPLQDWRQTFYNRFSPFISRLKNEGKDYELCSLINENMKTWFVETYGLEKRQEKILMLGPLNILHRKQGECPDMVNLAAYAMRSVGVPCCVDFTPYWATSSGGHYWNLTFDQNNKPIMFMGVTNNPGSLLIQRELGKVYRYMYSEQPDMPASFKTTGEIPEGFLQSPFIKDVTGNYVKTKNVAVEIQSQSDSLPDLGFFCVFNYSQWQILGWGKITEIDHRPTIEYADLGYGCVYLPIIRKNGKNIPAAYPFSVSHEGIMKQYIPNTKNARNIDLRQQDGYLIYRKGKEYTLYYWDNRWIRIKTKISAGSAVLTFEHVPDNALLFLRPEYSQGKDRIFTVNEKGEREWW
ncbi:MAG: hypothetical protein FWD60_00790 [Candidatus Azobacteroides sp.]|nr:hypothetical protein [Candidatus Azobacteroides sp.]